MSSRVRQNEDKEGSLVTCTASKRKRGTKNRTLTVTDTLSIGSTHTKTRETVPKVLLTVIVFTFTFTVRGTTYPVRKSRIVLRLRRVSSLGGVAEVRLTGLKVNNCHNKVVVILQEKPRL